jgi:hypothetical protein
MADETYTPIPDAAPPGPQTTISQGGDTASSSSSRETPTAATTQAMGAAQLASAQLPVAQQAVGDATELQQNVIADSQGQDADQKWQDNIDAQADAQQIRDRIDAANKDKQDALEATKGLKYENMWAHASTGKKILSGLGIALGGLSGNTEAMKQINDSIKNDVDQDHQLQKANIDQKYEQARLRGEDVNSLYTQWEHENGMQAAKEQRAHEAIAAKALEAQTRAGIPLSKAQNNLTIKTQLADAAAKNVDMQRAFDRKSQSTTSKQLTPSETTVIGKPGKQISDSERKADAEQFPRTQDAAPLLQQPLSKDEKTAVKQLLAEGHPEKSVEGIALTAAKDKLFGVNVDKLPPESRARVDAAVRLIPQIAKGSSPEAITAALESTIPDETDKSGRKQAALKNWLTTEGAGTPRPNYWQGKAADAAKAPAKVEPPPPGQLKKVMKDGVRGYLTPQGKFVPASAGTVAAK